MSGDYVSRDYLLGEYDRQHQGPPGGARKIIAEAPAADVVEVRHGRWERVGDYDKWICSECKEENLYAYSYGDDDYELQDFYCPSCGAKMDDNAIQHTECVGNALGELDEVEELSRYIDANKMADELSKVPWHDRKDEKQAVRMVKEFPAADVAEVVRCYECIYWEHRPDRQYDLCAYLFGAKRSCNPEDFCSRGERKGGQDDA